MFVVLELHCTENLFHSFQPSLQRYLCIIVYLFNQQYVTIYENFSDLLLYVMVSLEP